MNPARPLPRSRPVETVRPLAVGAAWFTTQFDCLAPSYWSGAGVIWELFKRYDFEAAGWEEDKTGIDDLGGSGGEYRRWRVTRDG
jgi:hypothetical protein